MVNTFTLFSVFPNFSKFLNFGQIFFEGDRLLLRYKSPIKSSESRFDIKQSETFEFEAFITYVEVLVEQVITDNFFWIKMTKIIRKRFLFQKQIISNSFQSTNESQLKATSGGEGFKYIELTIEGIHTYYFFYTTEIYGYFWFVSLALAHELYVNKYLIKGIFFIIYTKD